MSRSLNKACLIGNVGSDPEIRTTTGGAKVASFSLATSRSWNGANGEKQEKTEWHRCVVWNAGKTGSGLADVVEKYIKKGSKLYVEGAIENRQWQDKENQTRYTTEIRVRELLMLDSRRDGGDAPASRSSGAAKPVSRAAAPVADSQDSSAADQDDDLPF
jgi:single-strand DNA-binding protein